jgi:hypothetical protein
MEGEMAARELICRLQRYSICSFIFSLYTLSVRSGFAQMRRGPKLNLPDSSIVHGVEKPRSPAAALAARSANLTAPTVQQIIGDVYEYNYILPTGTGPYHTIGVHRVARVQNGRPLVRHNAVFLAHGTDGSFNTDFMNSAEPSHSLAVYLASNGIDVWGIDYGWALVPLSETDFTFMQSWGLQRDVDDLEAAILFARAIRAATGGDGARLALLGFSLSGWSGFALINQEAKRSCPARQVRAYVPIDLAFLTNDSSFQAASCADEAAYRQYVSQGFYNDDSSVYAIIGSLALTDPNGLSPVLPPYTNSQLSLVVGAAPWLLGLLIPPSAHYVAGVFGPSGINSIPVGLQYTGVSAWNNGLASTTPYEPILEEAELAGITCGDANPSYSDSLSLVRIPSCTLGRPEAKGTSDYTP